MQASYLAGLHYTIMMTKGTLVITLYHYAIFRGLRAVLEKCVDMILLFLVYFWVNYNECQ